MKTRKYLMVMASIIVFIMWTFLACNPTNSKDNGGKDRLNTERSDSTIYPTGALLLDDQQYLGLVTMDSLDIDTLLPIIDNTFREDEILLNTPPVRSQGSEGSCTAFASAYCVSSYY